MTLPIPLKPWEVRGILDGWLNQLVRPVHRNLCSILDASCAFGKFTCSADGLLANLKESSDELRNCPFGKPGDVLWVKEGYVVPSFDFDSEGQKVCYEADYKPGEMPFGIHPTMNMPIAYWIPSVLMKQKHSRLSILNVETTSERLQDFAHANCGSLYVESNVVGLARRVEQWNLDYPETPWESNPWVWVATIRKVQR